MACDGGVDATRLGDESLLKIREPVSGSPVVISLPHAGTVIPDRFAEALNFPREDLWSDWYTDELYNFVFDLDVTVVQAGLSRFVADPNRRPNPPLHGPFWNHVVPSTRPAGQPIYQQEPTAGELAERISIAHTPFHDALDVAVERAKRSSDSVLLLDLHSFGEPLVADVIVGDRHGQSASTPAVDIVVDCLEAVGLSTRRNERFSGGWIVQRFIGDAQVDAIQIELNQRTYLKSDAVEQFLPRPPKDPVRWAHTYQRLQDAFARLIPGYCSS